MVSSPCCCPILSLNDAKINLIRDPGALRYDQDRLKRGVSHKLRPIFYPGEPILNGPEKKVE